MVINVKRLHGSVLHLGSVDSLLVLYTKLAKSKLMETASHQFLSYPLQQQYLFAIASKYTLSWTLWESVKSATWESLIEIIIQQPHLITYPEFSYLIVDHNMTFIIFHYFTMKYFLVSLINIRKLMIYFHSPKTTSICLFIISQCSNYYKKWNF